MFLKPLAVPRHKRFLYRTGGPSLHIGITTPHQLCEVIEQSCVAKRGTPEEEFASTFKYASTFIRWLDDDWRTDELAQPTLLINMRAARIAKMFAEVHIEDGDCLGVAARELLSYLDANFPLLESPDEFDC